MSNNSFSKFNLIPPKSKEEIVSIKERDNTVLYAVFLIFFAVIIYSVFTLGRALLIDTRRIYLEESLSGLETQIKSYDSVKKINGELFIKSNALSPIVAQDIKLSSLIEVANKLIVNSAGTIITNYARQLEGTFEVSFEMNNYSDINIISRNSAEIDNLKNFYIKTIQQQNTASKVNAEVSFDLVNIDENE